MKIANYLSIHEQKVRKNVSNKSGKKGHILSLFVKIICITFFTPLITARPSVCNGICLFPRPIKWGTTQYGFTFEVQKFNPLAPSPRDEKVMNIFFK